MWQLCLWQPQRLHCRYQAKLFSVFNYKSCWGKKTAISNMLKWKAVINRTVNILLLLWPSDIVVWQQMCAHTHLFSPSSLHTWNTQTVEIRQTTEEKMAIIIQSTNGCSNVCGRCCKWPCITVVWDKGLFISNLQLSICCALVQNKTEKRRKVQDPEHRNGNVLQWYTNYLLKWKHCSAIHQHKCINFFGKEAGMVSVKAKAWRQKNIHVFVLCCAPTNFICSGEKHSFASTFVSSTWRAEMCLL